MSPDTRTSESGFTLIELLVAITVSGLILSALATGFIAALRATTGAHERFMGSNAAQTFATYFTSDVQSADPTAVRTDTVDTGCAMSSADTVSSNVVRLQWTESAGGSTDTKFFASYRVQQSGTEWQLVRYFCTGRAASDGATTNGTPNLVSTKAAFTSGDVGSGVSGANIPTGTKILSYTNATSVVLDHNATATATGTTITIEPAPSAHVVAHDLDAPGQRFTDGVTNGTTTFTSVSANFSAADVGLYLTASNIPAGTKISSVSNPTTVVMTSAATGSGSGMTFTVGRPVRSLTDGVTTSGSTTLTSTTAQFGAGDVGRALTGTNIRTGATISSIGGATTATMSSPATASATSVSFAVGAPYAVVGPSAAAPSNVSLTLSGVKASSDSAPYSYTVTASMRAPIPPPAVSSISLADPTPTKSASNLHWTVTFNRSVSGVDPTDFALAPTSGITGASGLSVTPASGPATTYSVTLGNTGSGDGTLGLNLVDDDSITDSASKKLGGNGTGNGNFTGDAYTIDKTAPTVVVAQKVDPDDATNNQPDPTNTLPIVFTVSFSEPVVGFDSTGVTLTGTAPVGTATKTVTGSRANYEVAVSGLSGGGTVIASVPAGSALDDAGNSSIASTSSDNQVTYVAGPASTTTSVSSSQNPSVVSQAVTYTATVAVVAPGAGTPTGNVEFFDGAAPIAACGSTTGVSLSGSTATCVVTYSASGTHTITAKYLGDSNYSASQVSSSLTQTVNPLPVVTIVDSAGSGHREIYSGTVTASSGTMTVDVYLGSSATGIPVKTYTTVTFTGSSSPYNWSIAPSNNNDLSNGSTYTARATFVDSNGNSSSPVTVTFTAH